MSAVLSVSPPSLRSIRVAQTPQPRSPQPLARRRTPLPLKDDKNDRTERNGAASAEAAVLAAPSPRFSSDPGTNDEASVIGGSSLATSGPKIRGLTGDLTIERQLLERGFTVQDVVLVSSNGTVDARFAVAVDGVGNSVMIDLDTEGSVTVKRNSVTLIDGHRCSRVPQSVKVGSFRCARPEVCGIAFRYQREVCILRSETATGEPTECTYVCSHDRAAAAGPQQANGADQQTCVPLGMPLVKLSELLASSVPVSENIVTVSRRLRNASLAKLQADATRLETGAKALYERSHLLNRMFGQQFERIGTKIQRFEAVHADMLARGATSARKDAAEAKAVLSINMAARQDMLRQMLEMSGSLATLNDEVSRLTASVDDVVRFLNTMYEGNNIVYKVPPA